MGVRLSQVVIVATACLTLLAACSSSSKLSDLWSAKNNGAPGVAAAGTGETTGSVAQPAALSAKAGVPGGNSDDDLRLGKKYFSSKDYSLAAQSFGSAVGKHPRAAAAWIGLATCYDHLHRFDLADRAYQQAISIVGPTAEILNDQGFSFMLRGEYGRAAKKLEEAEAEDPANPYVQANLALLGDRYFESTAVR